MGVAAMPILLTTVVVRIAWTTIVVKKDHARLILPKMVAIVFQMIFKSSQKDRRSTYSMSYLIHSWKSVPVRRVRLICHRPVMPGRTLSRASRQGGQYWFSWCGLGRG